MVTKNANLNKIAKTELDRIAVRYGLSQKELVALISCMEELAFRTTILRAEMG